MLPIRIIRSPTSPYYVSDMLAYHSYPYVESLTMGPLLLGIFSPNMLSTMSCNYYLLFYIQYDYIALALVSVWTVPDAAEINGNFFKYDRCQCTKFNISVLMSYYVLLLLNLRVNIKHI